MKKATFKVGDKVYCPKYFGTKIHILESCGMDNFPLQIDGCVAFNQIGKTTLCLGGLPAIFHATAENHTLLEKLYGVKFEAPPTPKEVIQKMLDGGWKGVPCYVANTYQPLMNKKWWEEVDVISNWCKLDKRYCGCNKEWVYAIPFDPKTGKIIIDYIDGEIVTE